jgi:hypothetical protein
MRNGRLPIAVPTREELNIGNNMELPIVTVDQFKIHQRDENFMEDQKLPILPMEEPNLRQPNERYEGKVKLPIISTEESKFHQRDEHYKGEDMRIEDSIPSRSSTLRESA